jgi:glycosyltransferase involved in cell wall biosynthesis
MQKKKVLILVDWFAPGYKAGGPIQSCVNLAFALKKYFDIYVLTTDTDHGEAKPYKEIISDRWINDLDKDIQVFYAKKKKLNAGLLKKHIVETNADVVYLNHLFSPLFVLLPLWLKFTGQLKSNIVVCPRGALYKSALAVKSWKKFPVLFFLRVLRLSKNVIFHATNEQEKIAIDKYFPGNRAIIADNLPQTNQPEWQSYKKEVGSLRCIYISRIVPIKNLLYLLACFQKVKANVFFTIIGPVEDAAYWNECEIAIKSLPLNINVIYAGAMKNSELLAAMHKHHIFILPTAGENFGHAIFESFSAGRPVLISDQTPWLELEKEKAGWALPLSTANGFIDKIELAAAWNQASFDEWSKGAWDYAHHFLENKVKIEPYIRLFA